MNIYLDTEFTGLHSKAELISIGLYADDGSSFYAEFEGYKAPTDWVLVNVIPHLTKKNYMTLATADEYIRFESDRQEIVNNLFIWLSQWNKCQIIGDTISQDWILFLDLFNHKLPHNVHYQPIDITTLFYIAGIDMNITRLDFVEMDDIAKHHALTDAMIIHLCYKKLMEKLNI
jgi:oligoribonuclease (3'-5' exoribonuclease)